MEIKVTDTINVTPVCTQTHTCPAGTAYWQVDYQYKGMVVHTATTGAIYGQPNPIAMLDYEHTDKRTVRDGDPALGEGWTKQGEVRVLSNGNHGDYAATEYTRTQTHRAAILAAISQLAE